MDRLKAMISLFILNLLMFGSFLHSFSQCDFQAPNQKRQSAMGFI